MSKLSFYRQHKINHKFEEYLTLLKNRRYKSAITKRWCSAHRLKIEIGRYVIDKLRVAGVMKNKHRGVREGLQNLFVKHLSILLSVDMLKECSNPVIL